MFKRVMLFLITNLAIVFVLGIVLNLLGVGRILDEQGLGLDLSNLIVVAAVFGFLASIIVFWFSRQREFRADAGGVSLAGREKMVSALEKLRSSVAQPHLPDQLTALGISGSVGHGLRRLFMTHPPLEERIAALKRGI